MCPCVILLSLIIKPIGPVFIYLFIYSWQGEKLRSGRIVEVKIFTFPHQTNDRPNDFVVVVVVLGLLWLHLINLG